MPEAGDPQTWNRYSYTLNNPIRYSDPTGHYIPVSEKSASVGVHPGTGRLYPFGSFDEAAGVVRESYAGVDDLEGLALTSDFAATKYDTIGGYMGAMGTAFIGTTTTGPCTLIAASAGQQPSGMKSWGEKGFHEDYRDRQWQPYHAWAYVAQATTYGQDPAANDWAVFVGGVGNFAHEIGETALIDWLASKTCGLVYLAPAVTAGGRSWEDYYLSFAAMELGEGLTSGAVSPAQAGNWMRLRLGPSGGGSGGQVALHNRIPWFRRLVLNPGPHQ